MAHSRLLTITGLAVAGALCAGTAASVYAAALPRQLEYAEASRADVASAAAGDGWATGAEPTASALWRLAADRRVPFATRLRTAHVLAVGACLNPREVLFGPQAARRAALDSLAARLSDLPQAPTAVGAARSVLEAFDEGTPVWSDPRSDAGADPAPQLLPWLVPDKVTRRVRLCRTLLAE